MKNLKPGNKYTKKITIKRILLLLQSDVVWNSKLCLFIRAGELVVSMIRRLNNARRSWSCIRPPPPPPQTSQVWRPDRLSELVAFSIIELFLRPPIYIRKQIAPFCASLFWQQPKKSFHIKPGLKEKFTFCQDWQEKTQRQEKPFERPTSFKGLARDERDNDERLCNDYYSKKPLTHGRCDTWG